jgi:hypothetical protein
MPNGTGATMPAAYRRPESSFRQGEAVMGDVGSVVRALRSAKSAVVENAKQDLRSLRHLRGRAKDWWLNRRVDMGSGRVEQPLPWDEATEGHIWRDAERCLRALDEKSDDTRADSICTYEEGVVDAITSFARTAKDCAGDPESWATAELDLKKGNKGPRSQLEEQSVIMMRTALRDRANKKPDESLQHLRNQADNFFNALDKIEGPDGKKLDPEVIRTSRAVLGLIMEACNERLARKKLPPHFLGPKRSKRKQKPEYQKVKDRAIKRAFTNFVVEPGLLNALVSGEDPMPMVNKLSDVYRVFGEEKLRVALCLTFRDFRNAKDRNPNDYLKLKPAIDRMGRRAAALLEISKDKPMLRFKAEAMKVVHDAYYLATFPPDKRDLKGVPPLEPPGVADRAWAQIRRAVGPKNPELTCRIYAVVESVLLKNRDVAPIEKLVDFLAWGDTSNIWQPLVAAFGVLPPQDVEHLRIFGATMEIIAQHDLPADTPWRAKAKTLGSVAGIIAHAHHSAHDPDVSPPPWRTDETDHGRFCYQLLVKYAFETLDDVDTYVKSLKGLLSLAHRDKDAFFAAVDQVYERRSSSTRATLLEKVRAADAAITSRSDLDYEIYEMSEKILDRLRGPVAVYQDERLQPDMESFAPPLVRSEVTIIDLPPLQRGVMITQNAVMVADEELGHATFNRSSTPELDQLLAESESGALPRTAPPGKLDQPDPIQVSPDRSQTSARRWELRPHWKKPRKRKVDSEPVEQKLELSETKVGLSEADIRQARDKLAIAIKNGDFARFFVAIQTIEAMKAQNADMVRAVLEEKWISFNRRFWGVVQAVWDAVQKSADFTDDERTEVARVRRAWTFLRAELELGSVATEAGETEVDKAVNELKDALKVQLLSL